MPHPLNNDTSFSSKQELLVLHDSPLGPSLDTPSPVESQGSGPSSLSGDAHTVLHKTGKLGLDHTEPPTGVKFVPTDSENRCGWGALTLQCIQTFNTPRWFLFFLCVASFLQGMIINGFINTVITSIERRFDLRSYQVNSYI
ncbi:solute carrier organic anion transporter family member 4A1-like [Cyprinus carpio]|uniref:Solute carrier organic anion transporter family member 4A1-like n=1 Tax=Cyprinus carpio TaxID=7962 RepID=A0A9Q9VP91_CYPCA|nr:solute carrier organic anion transporter family member 4A1-like [Cyprinus carpio]XP_042568686.1 solute carrier organic anion transporter family member 4A1-like [Cyprinus carpio]